MVLPISTKTFLHFIYSPPPPIKKNGKATETVNLWREDLVDGQWQALEYLANVNSPANDLYPSLTNNGGLCFPSFRDNKRQMYAAKANGKDFDAPTPIPITMFGEGATIGDSVVLPDGKTIIFWHAQR